MIPNKFKIFGQEIKIEFDAKLMFKDDAIGQALYRENKIVLKPNTKEYPICKSRIDQTFYHELVHMLLHHLGEYELQKNEKFVDLMGNALHQYNETKEK